MEPACCNGHVQLRDATAHGVEVRVTGYQFPDAEDPQQRYSWHVVEGHALTAEGDWHFHFAALTCDETPLVGPWLREAATRDASTPLRFTEPNLGFAAVQRDASVVDLTVELDIEFLPPWRKPEHGPIYAGNPYAISLRLPSGALLAAADQWEAEAAPFPDGLVEGVE